jgi:hypothetical protein
MFVYILVEYLSLLVRLLRGLSGVVFLTIQYLSPG